MTAASLLIRADASVAMGTGHVMRCLALAQAWQDAGGRVVFAMAETTLAIQARLAIESCNVLCVSAGARDGGDAEDARQTISLARERQAEWIVVDGYQFNADYQRAIKAAGFKLLFLDDFGHAHHYCADIVLNQNVCASESLYQDRQPETRLLLGPRYSLLRREFSAWRDWQRVIAPQGHRILVIMGGSDPENVTARAMEALSLLRLENFEATVVVGGSNPNLKLLERAAEQASARIRICGGVSNIAELMAWADVAVSAAGSICWELCLLALPALLIDVASNQTAVAHELQRLGCALHLGGSRDVSAQKIAEELARLLRSEEERRSLSCRARGLVDGRGAGRVMTALRGGLQVRPAQENDSPLLWEWANDPQVRAVAFSAATIPWEKHKAWFASKMNNPDCLILIAEDEDGKAIGQFRVDWRSPQDGEIDVSVSRHCRGRGYGAKVIRLSVETACEQRPGARFHAFVKPDNQASRSAFEAAGFRNLGEENVSGHRAVHYLCSPEQGQTLRSK